MLAAVSAATRRAIRLSVPLSDLQMTEGCQKGKPRHKLGRVLRRLGGGLAVVGWIDAVGPDMIGIFQ